MLTFTEQMLVTFVVKQGSEHFPLLQQLTHHFLFCLTVRHLLRTTNIET